MSESCVFGDPAWQPKAAAAVRGKTHTQKTPGGWKDPALAGLAVASAARRTERREKAKADRSMEKDGSSSQQDGRSGGEAGPRAPAVHPLPIPDADEAEFQFQR